MTFHHTDAAVSASAWADSHFTRDPVTLDGVRRIVVVAAHPDDETLGAGGLMATATAASIPLDVLVLTAGEGSHPHSPTHSRDMVSRLRAEETYRAAAALGLKDESVSLSRLPDGQLADHLDEITAMIVEHIGRLASAGEVLVVAPYRRDGHPDHETAGVAAAAAAHRTDAVLWEYPIWFRHQHTPDELTAGRLRTLPLTPAARAAKGLAIEAHHSQTSALSDQPGDEAILQPDFLQHFAGPEVELFMHGDTTPDTGLDDLHSRTHQPWGADTRWYERRKRQLTLAMLPRDRFEHALEIGCSTGVLTEQLATIAHRVDAIDSSPVAITTARRQVPANVTLHIGEVPGAWPAASYDLVVLSEVGYFLSPAALAATVERTLSCLTADGVVLLSHWRHRIDGWPLDAAAVHEAFARSALPAARAVYRDRDVEMVLHCAAPQMPDPAA